MYIFEGNFSEQEKEKLKELTIKHEQAINEDGGCSFTGEVEAYVEKRGDDIFISNKNMFIKH